MSTSIPFSRTQPSSRSIIRGPSSERRVSTSRILLAAALGVFVGGCDALGSKLQGVTQASPAPLPPPVYSSPSTNDFVLARAAGPSIGQDVATFVAERRGAAVDPVAATPGAEIPAVPPGTAIAPEAAVPAPEGTVPVAPAAAVTPVPEAATPPAVTPEAATPPVAATPPAVTPAAATPPAVTPVPAPTPAEAPAEPNLPSVDEEASTPAPAPAPAESKPKSETKRTSSSSSSPSSSSSTSSSSTTKKKPKEDDDDKTETKGPSGRTIYANKCKSCHGVSGKADTPMGVKLGMTSFKTPGWKREWTEAKVIEIVTKGKAGSKMKPFEGKLTPAEIEAVARFARAIGQ